MKIYLLIAALFAALFIYTLKLSSDKAVLLENNEQILRVNEDLNKAIKEVVRQNKRDNELIKQAYELERNNSLKTTKAMNYVKNSKESNLTSLFNDSVLLLQ